MGIESFTLYKFHNKSTMVLTFSLIHPFTYLNWSFKTTVEVLRGLANTWKVNQLKWCQTKVKNLNQMTYHCYALKPWPAWICRSTTITVPRTLHEQQQQQFSVWNMGHHTLSRQGQHSWCWLKRPHTQTLWQIRNETFNLTLKFIISHFAPTTPGIIKCSAFEGNGNILRGVYVSFDKFESWMEMGGVSRLGENNLLNIQN